MTERGGDARAGAAVAGAPMSRRAFIRAAALGLAAAGGAALAGCDVEGELSNMAGVEQAKRTVTDHAGRSVEIPSAANLKRVGCTSALAEFFVFTAAPDLLGATTGTFDAEDLKYLPEGVGELPCLGSITEGTLNPEGLMLEDIQLVFSISAVALTEANVDEAQKLQDQTKIPFVLIDGSMDKIGEAYRFLGECLGRAERVGELGAYCERVYADVTSAVGGLDDVEKVRVYYAEGTSGLQSEPRGTQHAVAFDIAGLYNVVGGEDASGLGMVDVSLETVLAGDPDAIVAWSLEHRGGADETIRSLDAWKEVKAVRDGRVYTMPDVPFAWLDRPGAANRFLGIQWLANLFYPELYDIDIVAAVQEFYNLFYHVEVSDAEAVAFLGNSYTGEVG